MAEEVVIGPRLAIASQLTQSGGRWTFDFHVIVHSPEQCETAIKMIEIIKPILAENRNATLTATERDRT